MMEHVDRIWELVLQRTQGRPHSVHGPDHWVRVERNGLYLAGSTGADPVIVSLFAVFHDAMRVNDHDDPGHGERGAQLARSMAGEMGFLSALGLETLCHACTWHTDRHHDDDITVGTCWDADRLDLGRVGIRPRARFLNTEPARTLAAAADLSPLQVAPLRPVPTR